MPDLTILRHSATGISLVLSTLIYLGLGVWGGRYLDRQFGTEPLFLLAGLLLGMAGGLASLYWQVSALMRPATRKASRGGALSDRGSGSADENGKGLDTDGQTGGRDER